MSEMIEKVARAIVSSWNTDPDEDFNGAPAWEAYTDSARAAIDAMREPLLAIIAKEEQDFLSPEYATGQPLSSFSERFACRQVSKAITAALSL